MFYIIYAISMNWLKQWENFVQGNSKGILLEQRN